MLRSKILSILGLLLVVLFLSLTNTGCEKDDGNTPGETSVASCEGCHTNYVHLQAVYTPDTAAPAGGCGGDAPHYEPYDRVFMGGSGYEEYKTSGHYQIGCTGCHNGTDGTDDKQLAHSGDFLRHPSAEADEKCGSCHQQIVDNFKTSLHNGTGQMRKVAMRSGFSGASEFDQLPQHQIEGYNANCATCHGTCGNCHIVRPPIGGGGLAKGHMFNKTPDMVSVCVTCHTSRGGHAYLGVAPGTQPDVHLTSMQFKCDNCHSGNELHGDGEPVDQRYAYSKLPECENCHADLEGSNTYHSMHYDDFNCQVCHSQDYNNCGSCHIHGEGARIPSYMDYKIALNPIPDIKTGFKFTLVRRTLAAPDNWEKYGVDNYANFDVFPTYNFTTPHNLLRWTERTQVDQGKSCSSNCHIRNDGGTLVNRGLYLFDDDLLDWEKSASNSIIVDGELPESWFESK
jgi:thiosulfate/3-mercaptopyruvate sulfurtransferase